MFFLEAIAERRIREAVERGDLDHLPGAGKPLPLEGEAAVPAHLRSAYRLPKNAGCVPPEVALRREIHTVEELIRAATTDEARSQGLRRWQLLRMRLGESRRGANPRVEERYLEKLIERFS
jgi:hypothetical protein